MHLKPIQLQKPVSEKDPVSNIKTFGDKWISATLFWVFSPQIQYEEIHLSPL